MHAQPCIQSLTQKYITHTTHTLTHYISTVYINSCVTGNRLRGVHHRVRHYRACTRGARVVETGLVLMILIVFLPIFLPGYPTYKEKIKQRPGGKPEGK